MALNPPAQYADDRNLAARQRFWRLQRPPFDTEVRAAVQKVIDEEGAFLTAGDIGAFVCG